MLRESTESILLARCSRRHVVSVVFRIELERETDGRWIAEVIELPGVLAYGLTQDEAVAHVQALALRVVADRLEKDEAGSEFLNISFLAA
jgi:predicted RNase H-like HicB family nuclease